MIQCVAYDLLHLWFSQFVVGQNIAFGNNSLYDRLVLNVIELCCVSLYTSSSQLVGRD